MVYMDSSEQTKRNNESIESVFRHVNREVWIVTSSVGERRGGLVATWVSRASLDSDRPAVLIGIAPNHYTAEIIDSSKAFALHLITREQIDIAWNFAIGSGRIRDKFANIDATTGQTGSPILTRCLAWIECQVFARLPSGDRTYYWADVVAAENFADDVPLRERDLIEAASKEQLELLRHDRGSDIEIQRPLQDKWRDEMPSILRPA